MVIEHAPFDLHALMKPPAALFEPEAKRSQLHLTKSVSVDAPYLLLGDDVRIQQVLINLARTRSGSPSRGSFASVSARSSVPITT